MPGRTLVVGDIHGAYKALEQVLEKSNFAPSEDLLICLGDVCDGWPETRLCLERLLSLDHMIYILGNHDYWALKWMKGQEVAETWSFQGGDATVTSYNGKPEEEHIKFLEAAHLFYLIENTVFVHAGIDPSISIEKQSKQTLLWDREFAHTALEHFQEKRNAKLTDYDEVFIGHTPIHNYGFLKPIKACEVWLMDTGAGWNGCLSMMDVHTKEVFTSDSIPDLYPNHSGRF